MSSEINPPHDSTAPSQASGPIDFDLASMHNETSNDEKTNNEENIDSNFLIEAVHHKNEGKIVVPEPKQQDQLRNKGFGEVFNKEYLLNSLESLYLLQNNKIKIYRNKTEYDFSTFLKSLIKKDKKILTKYLIFRDLRSKGYVVKEGFGFGTDFRIYERGEYNKKTSKYVSIGLNEGTNIKASEFAEVIEQVEKMGKLVVIAVVERRGEVIYYKSSKMTFFDNKKSKKSVT
jgi:tRNA-intron endonuclease, archaea type